MRTAVRYASVLSALALSCSLAAPAPGLAQSRSAGVSVGRDEIEPCFSFDPTGALAQCQDLGALFEGTGRAAVPSGGSPRLEVSAGASIQGAPGAPLFESVGAQAALQDLIRLGGVATPARVTLVFRVTGALSQSVPDAAATLQVDVAGQGQVWSADQSVSVDETISVTLDLSPGVSQDLSLFASARATMFRLDAQSAGGSATVGGSTPASIRLETVQITDAGGAPLPGATLTSDLGYTYPVAGPPQPPGGLVAAGPVTLWLRATGDDNGAPLDVRAELYRDGTLLASGEARCLRDLGDRRNLPREVRLALGALADHELEAGDVLALRVLARMGTNADGTSCAPVRRGPVRSDGLRLFYDSAIHPSRLAVEPAGEAPGDIFLRAGGPGFSNGRRQGDTIDAVLRLDLAPPTDEQGKFRDSGPLDLNRGNPWNELDAWSIAVP